MICRCCGFDNNGRDTGRCANCGFDLGSQNEPLKEQRAGLQHKLEKPVNFKERTEFKTPPPRGHVPAVAILIAIAGLTAAYVITHTFQRSEYSPELPEREEFMEIVDEAPVDSVSLKIGSDIVYVFDDSASRALPRSSVDMTLIPEGSTVSFLGSNVVPLRPATNYILQKINQREFNPLTIDRLCVWIDSTETEYISSPLIRLDQSLVDSIPGAVIVKLYFTPEMLRGSVEEFSILYDKPVETDDFTDSQLRDLLGTVSRRLASRDYGDREVQVAVLFDYNAYRLGDAVRLMNRIAPQALDTLGYTGFAVSVFSLTD